MTVQKKKGQQVAENNAFEHVSTDDVEKGFPLNSKDKGNGKTVISSTQPVASDISVEEKLKYFTQTMVTAILVFGLAGYVFLLVRLAREEKLEQRVDQLQQEAGKSALLVMPNQEPFPKGGTFGDGEIQPIFPTWVSLPQQFSFAGENFNLRSVDSQVRFGQGLSWSLNHSAEILAAVYYDRLYMEPIRRAAARRGMPEDVCFVPLIESRFDPLARSFANARSVWQFTEPTAESYGLVINQWIDERYDFIRATDAALRYLDDMEQNFSSKLKEARSGKPDGQYWMFAFMAYNGGESKIWEALREQGEWNQPIDLVVNDETSRYAFRLFAVKYWYERRHDLGAYFNPDTASLPRWDFQTATIQSDGFIQLRTLAELCGVNLSDSLGYRQFYLPNAKYRRHKIPPGVNEVYLPPGVKVDDIRQIAGLDIRKKQSTEFSISPISLR